MLFRSAGLLRAACGGTIHHELERAPGDAGVDEGEEDLEDREDPEHQRVGLGARIHASNDPVGRGDGAVQLRRAALRPPHPERVPVVARSEEHTSELQSLMRISYAVFCLKKKTNKQPTTT